MGVQAAGTHHDARLVAGVDPRFPYASLLCHGRILRGASLGTLRLSPRRQESFLANRRSLRRRLDDHLSADDVSDGLFREGLTVGAGLYPVRQVPGPPSSA